MEKCFNTAGICYPEEHYMVNLDSRLQKIVQMVDKGQYFTINRGRQYGKTTMMNLLAEKLSGHYSVFSISFEGIGDELCRSEEVFCQTFLGLLNDALCYEGVEGISEAVRRECRELSEEIPQGYSMMKLSGFISRMCGEADRPVVLMVDEVDQAGDHGIFITFLGLLRKKFLARKRQPAFQSVILAGVYDVRNLKLRIRQDSEHQYNSPWNIAANLALDMSFSAEDIAGMLAEYEGNHHVGMDIPLIAGLLHDYTSGYPFLVSRLCELMDMVVPGKEGFPDRCSAWTKNGVTEAVKELLAESNPLFDDMVKKLEDFPELKRTFYAILFRGEKFVFNTDNRVLDIGRMFGMIKSRDGAVAIANRIFETRLYNLFLSEEMLNSTICRAAEEDRNRFVRDGHLDMELVLERFVESFTDIYSDAQESFLEENGRRFFLLYLKPIINGAGNYYVEARTRDMRRTDIIIDYRGEQYVCEMKIWRGNEYNSRGERQLIGYLDDYHLTKGYMVSFNFNKKKETGVREIVMGGRILVEAVV